MGNFEFEAESGRRFMRYFRCVYVTDASCNLWFNVDNGVWEDFGVSKNCVYSTAASCKTFRAFVRMLRKNPKIIGRCSLISDYVGFDVVSVGVEL